MKHYFEKILKDNTSQEKVLTQLRKDELLYDEAFIIVKVRHRYPPALERTANLYESAKRRCSWRLRRSKAGTRPQRAVLPLTTRRLTGIR